MKKKYVNSLIILLMIAIIISIVVSVNEIIKLNNIYNITELNITSVKKSLVSNITNNDNGYYISEEEIIFNDLSLGLMTFSNSDTEVVLTLGIEDEQLVYSAGLSTDLVKLNSHGNSVFYGHRDNIFRHLKEIEIGDKITIDLLNSCIDYTVDDIYITSPNDVKIHNETNALTITLVTCYPFSYFGPAPDRYVVVASQSK